MSQYKQFASKFRKKRLSKAYKLQGEMEFHGLVIKIENRLGSLRHWKDADGNEGTTKMRTRYGYIARSPKAGLDKQTLGVDGDAVDVYLSDISPESEKVFVIHQKNPSTGEYDEDKCMLGFDTAEQAKDAYLKQYDSPDFFESLEEFTMDEFKQALITLRGRKISKLEKAFDLLTNASSYVFTDKQGSALFTKAAHYAAIFEQAGLRFSTKKHKLYKPASAYSKTDLAKALLSKDKFVSLKLKFSNKRHG